MKYYWKYLVASCGIFLLGYGLWWLVQLIWLRPSNIALFYDRITVEYANRHPQWNDLWNLPVATKFSSSSLQIDPLFPTTQDTTFWSEEALIMEGYDEKYLDPKQQIIFDRVYEWINRRKMETRNLSMPAPLHYVGRRLHELLFSLCVTLPLTSNEEAETYIAKLNRVKPFLVECTEYILQTADTTGKGALLRYLEAIQVKDPLQSPLYTTFASRAAKADPISFNRGRATDLLASAYQILQVDIAPQLELMKSRLVEKTDDKKAPHDKVVFTGSLAMYGNYAVDIDSLYNSSLKRIDSLLALMHSIKDSLALENISEKMLWPAMPDTTDKVNYFDLIGADLARAREETQGLFTNSVQEPILLHALPEQITQYADPMTYLPSDLGARRKAGLILNLRRIRNYPRWLLPAMMYAEVFPGAHSLHAHIASDKELHVIYKTSLYPIQYQAWGIYMLQNMDEELLYFSGDPYIKLGYYHYMTQRWADLIADIGMHYIGWDKKETRELYQKYTLLPDTEIEAVITQIERYPAKKTAIILAYQFFREEHERNKKAEEKWNIQDQIDAFFDLPLQNSLTRIK